MYVATSHPRIHFPFDLARTSCRSRPRPPLRSRSFRTTSRSALFISITGMQSSSSSPAYMTLFERVAIPCRVIPLQVGRRVRLYGKQQSTGYTLITSFRSNSRLCVAFLFLVCCLPSPPQEAGLTESLTSQYLIPTRSSSQRTRLLPPFTLTTKILASTWAVSRKLKAHRQFVSAGTEILITPKSSSSVRLIVKTGLVRSQSRRDSRSRKIR